MSMRPLHITPLALLLLLSLPVVSSQSGWDLAIEKVNLASASVRRGEPLKMAVYIRNNENNPFLGVINVTMLIDESRVPVLMEFICFGGDAAACPSPSAPGFGVKDLPARGYVSLVFDLDTSGISPGTHKLTIEVRPRGYTDPDPSDNRYSVGFTVESGAESYSMPPSLLAALAVLIAITMILLVRRRNR